MQAAGLATPVQVMQCGGGVVPAAQAARRAFLTLDSGPVAGVLASQYLGRILGQKHVIATDMGGTSFDVGLVYDGTPVASYQRRGEPVRVLRAAHRRPLHRRRQGQHHLARRGERGPARGARVGASADPGPVCYGRGGTEPTVTDAAVALGYLDPDNFLGGRLPLEPRGRR